jgi:hypothetical protein
VARFALDPADRRTAVPRALGDSDAAVRVAALERAAEDPVSLPESAVLVALQDARTRLAALRALRTVPPGPIAARIEAWARDPGADAAVRVAALDALGRSGLPFSPPESWYATATDELLVSMLACETRGLPAIFFSKTPPPFLQRYLGAESAAVRGAAYEFLLGREEIWAKQPVVALLEGDADAALRAQVLAALPSGYVRDGSLLAKIAAKRDDALRLEALRMLDGKSDADSVAALRAIAADQTDDPTARLLAATALPPAERKDLVAQLF